MKLLDFSVCMLDDVEVASYFLLDDEIFTVLENGTLRFQLSLETLAVRRTNL